MKNKISAEGAEWKIKQILNNVIKSKEKINNIINQVKKERSLTFSSGLFRIEYTNKYGVDHFTIIE